MEQALHRCSNCHEAKPAADFASDATTKTGLQRYCRVCSTARQHEYYVRRGGNKGIAANRYCSRCRQTLPKTSFTTGPGGRLRHQCVTCDAEETERTAAGLKFCNLCRKWELLSAFYPSQINRKNVACIEGFRTYNRKPEAMLHRRSMTLVKEYGITLDQYKELLAKQGHKCPICLEPFEPDNFSYPLDHSHGGRFVGRIRAILHQDCNRFVMWMHEDSAQLRRAADLIDNPLTDWIVPNPTANERRREKERQK